MRKRKEIGIFAKTFFYTLTLILIILTIVVVFFASQFVRFYAASKENQVMETTQSLARQLDGRSEEEVLKIVRDFIERNTALDISISGSNGGILYRSPSSDVFFDIVNGEVSINEISASKVKAGNYNSDNKMQSVKVNLKGEEAYLTAIYHYSDSEAYAAFFKMLLIGLLVALLVSALGAAGYAKTITQPIRKLARDTVQMSEMKPVSVPPVKNDEIGQLTTNVHQLYQSLRTTISDLKIEMDHVRQMEENQRYFFSAASHELKTPIAATNALLEGMMENVGDYKNHPKYLTECLKMMNSLNKLVVEILELVRLTDKKMLPEFEVVEPANMVKSLLPAYQSLAVLKNQSISVCIPPDQSCRADSKMLRRVFSNVIMNAIQNAPENGYIRIWSEERSSMVVIYILNQGHIEENAITKVFEPFYRMDTIRNRKDGHSGLGLTIVKELMNSMQYPYNICNTEEGVLFYMELPVNK